MTCKMAGPKIAYACGGSGEDHLVLIYQILTFSNFSMINNTLLRQI